MPNLEKKVLRKLTKRNYLGEGYIHVFSNNETGEIVNVPCTKAQYEKLGKKNGARFNPTLEGHTLIGSLGGTIKVDTPDTMLGFDEYCVVEDKVHILLKDEPSDDKFQILDLDSIDELDNLDERKLIKRVK